MTGQNAKLVDRFLAFYRRHAQQALAQFAHGYPHDTSSITIDWSTLATFDRNLAEDFIDQPDTVRELAEDALARYDFPVEMNESLDASNVTVRLTNLPDGVQHDVGHYSPTHVEGTIRSIRGQVSQVTQPDTHARIAVFECQRCGTGTRVPQSDGSWQEPRECQGCERQGPFQMDFDASTLVDHQVVRLQTPPEQVTDGGTDTIDYEVFGDVVGSISPGERVLATGQLNLRQTDDDRPTFSTYGEADSFEHLERDLDAVKVEAHRDEFQEIADSGEAMEQIVESIAPTIYGYDRIKEAVALMLFGGVRKELPDGSTRRGSPHVLMVGDPGLGKTQIIQYATDIAPRSVYTSGQGSTKAGLTASAVQDDFGDGGWTIQAGALVQAHKGVAGIDELDKMNEEDRDGLLEAMESQTVSKNAAGKNVTLPAQTTVLAGANPEQGRFNEYESLGEQVDLHAALFSRFDLIFTMTDDRDEDRDMAIADTILDTNEVGQRLAGGDTTSDIETSSAEPTIEPDVLRAYIAYARQEVFPVLTDDAREVIRQRYRKIRTATEKDGPVPTTPRSIEGMIRLAEAKARTRLSDTISVEDAQEVCDMVESALRDVGVDPDTGEFDADILESGTSHSQRQRIKQTLAILRDLAEEDEFEYGVPEDRLHEMFSERGFKSKNFDGTIQKLLDKGEIYEPATDKFLPT